MSNELTDVRSTHWEWVKVYRKLHVLATCPASAIYADGNRRWHVRRAWEARKARRGGMKVAELA